MRAIETIDELSKLVDQEIAVTDWIGISQEQIKLFAEATGDRQWIHLDVERSRAESPFGGTIAHGFLVLSLLPALLDKAVTMPACRMAVNYGLNKVRFPAPVFAGNRVRGRLTPLLVEGVTGGTQITWRVEVEAEHGEKPVCVAELIVRLYN